MAKIHLQGNKGVTRSPMALCSIRYTGNGKVRDNGRRSYVGMGSPIVSMEQFQATSHTDRCAHCCEALLAYRNRKRREEGKEPVKAYNEGWGE